MVFDLTNSYCRTERLDGDLVAGDRLVLCDLDGCLVSQNFAFDDGAAFVEACGDRLWIVSNNSTHLADVMSRNLAALGLSVPTNRILLVGEQTLLHLNRLHPGASLELFGTKALQELAEDLDFDLGKNRPDIVLLCRDTGFSLEKLNRLAGLLHRGAELWVSNTDVSHPAQDGAPIAETGALLAAVNAMVPELTFQTVGKPHPHLADIALGQTGVSERDAVFVGDNPSTDGAIAAATGLRFVHLQREGGKA